MDDHWLEQAVLNNAAWCDAIATAQGLVTNWSDSVWCCKQPMPRFYPNLITLQRGHDVHARVRAVDQHLDSSLGWGIKDSFKELALAEQGFVAAFDAQWYCRAPDSSSPTEWAIRRLTGYELETVSDPAAFGQWVEGWGEGAGIFEPQLLDNDAVELRLQKQGGQIVAGFAANRSGDVVGVSNTFGRPDAILAGIVAVIAENPGAGVVGYGSDAQVAALQEVGFRPVGGLRIWTRRED